MIVETESSHINSAMGSELPPLSVNTMSQVQLTEFIPQLVCMVTGRQNPQFGKKQFKPEWWPDSVAWRNPDTSDTTRLPIKEEPLRDIVTSCYRYLGQESLLTYDRAPDTAMPDQPKVDQVNNKESSQEPKGACKQETPDDPIWICFLCAKQFPNQDDLMTHQDLCEQEEEQSQTPVAPPQPTAQPSCLYPPQPTVLSSCLPPAQPPSHITIQPRKLVTAPRPVTLPPLSVNTMSQVQLTEFIPQLVCMVTGRQNPQFGKKQFKPEWWPDSVAWRNPDTSDTTRLPIKEEPLRDIVTSCYRYLGQESLLTYDRAPDTAMPDQPKVDQVNNKESSQEPKGACKQETPDDPIWICFLCAKQFPNQDDLMTHQDLCEQEEEQSQTPVAPPQPTAQPSCLYPPQPTVLSSCLPPAQPPSHITIQPRKLVTAPRPVTLLYRKRKKFKVEPYVYPPREDFIKALCLSDKPKERPRTVSPVSDIDSDCEIIDVTFDESAAKTPRTLNTLMSQLSRDVEHSGRKRHLSFSLNVELPEEYSTDDSDSDAEYGARRKTSTPYGTLLVGIDLTSPLGQRVKKHWKINTNYSIITSDKIEDFCSGPMNNDFVEKLRHRGETAYPTVFNKKNRKHMAKHKHMFKFNSNQRKEFMLRLKTGLSKRSRKLLKEIVKCSVKLERLKPRVIRKWMKAKPPPPYPYAYIRRMFEQDHPIIKKIVPKFSLGPKYFKLKQISNGLRKLNRPHNLLPNQRMVTQVVHNTDGTKAMRMIPANLPSSAARQQVANTGTNRRKQAFDQSSVRQSDIEIIELSSSDDSDEEADKTLQNKLTGSQVNQMTHLKNITGVSLPQQAVRATMSNTQRSSVSGQLQRVPGTGSPKINNFSEIRAPGMASPNNTRARIFQGMKGILSPSPLQNQPSTMQHSSLSVVSTCRENSKPVSGFASRVTFKDSVPQILRTSQNSPQKVKPVLQTPTFPGFIPIQTTVSVPMTSGTGFSHSQTNGSLVLGSQKRPSIITKPNGGSPKPLMPQTHKEPAVEADVIIIDDD